MKSVPNIRGQRLDRLVCVTINLHGHPRPAFLVCGYTGLVLAIALALTLTWYQGLSMWVMSGLIVSAMATFLILAMLTNIITGEEQLIYYHHEIAVLAVAACMLWIWRQPVLPYLDAQLLGVGTFLACGRVGCLMVGCCHGVPHRWGVRYRQEHADAGFTPHLVGVRLLPIQLIESVFVLLVVLVGAFFVLNGNPAGTAFAWYVVCYDIGRFFFEFVRGDPQRPYYGSFSEGQWISIGLMVLLVAAESAGLLPLHVWHVVATLGLVLTMVFVAVLRRRRNLRHVLLNAYHLQEVAEALELVRQPSGDSLPREPGAAAPQFVPVACTSLGVRISGGRLDGSDGANAHYALSSDAGLMSESAARTLADLIIRLRHPQAKRELISGNQGVYHLVIRDADNETRGFAAS